MICLEKVLEVKNLTKYYGKTLGVQDVNFELRKGEIFGFIGPNGAGKSTTIRSILGLINKTSGQVIFNGKKLAGDDIEAKKKIGYLPSEVNLYDDLTVKEMLDFHAGFFNTDLTERRNELLERLKLDQTKKIEELSLGNLKKTGIVLALMHSPELLILDEPTSGLDPIIQKEFFDLLQEEKQNGTTIFYSTHILSEISKICDRVGIIRSGKMLKIEHIKELIDKTFSYVVITSGELDAIIKTLKLTDYTVEDNTLTFKNTVGANALIKALAGHNIEKIYIEPASIEDIFLHYYE